MRKNETGFTLVELVIGVALMLMIMAALAVMLTNLIGHGVRGVALTDRQQEARWVLDMVAQDVRIADASTITPHNSSGTSIEFIKQLPDGSKVKIHYEIGDDPNASGQTLIRKVWVPSTAGSFTASSPLGDASKNYVTAGYFTVTTSSETVSSVDRVRKVVLQYKVGRDKSDTNPVTVTTTVYPLNFQAQ